MAGTGRESSNISKAITRIVKECGSLLDSWKLKTQIFAIFAYRFLSELVDAEYAKQLKLIWVPGAVGYRDFKDDNPFLLKEKENFIERIGFFIQPSDLFRNVVKDLDDRDPLALLSEVFKRINDTTRGSIKDIFKHFDIDTNVSEYEYHSNVKTLSIILKVVKELSLKKEDFDILGDIYELLMSTYFGNGGKAGGEFYTPTDLATLLARLVDLYHDDTLKIYDPTCGSGSLLLRLLKIHKKDRTSVPTIYGQEINPTTYNLCRLNMLINGLSYDKINIQLGDTLLNDKLPDEKFDAIISNPPFGLKWPGKDKKELLEDPRFKHCPLSPKNAADFAFILHGLHHLKDDGVLVTLCFPGILYRGRAEKQIRKYLVDNNYVEGIIQLPPNLFFNTSISTCILILKKNRDNNLIRFVDASDIYTKKPKKNKLTEEQIDAILELYQCNYDNKNKRVYVTLEKIKERDYNLSVAAWINNFLEEDEVDIKKLNEEIKERRKRINQLWDAMDEIVRKIEDNDY